MVIKVLILVLEDCGPVIVPSLLILESPLTWLVQYVSNVIKYYCTQVEDV